MFMNEERTLFTDAVYRATQKHMKLLGERFGLPITALQIKFDGLDVLKLEQRMAAVQAVKQVSETNMPDFVQAFEYRQSGREYALIVPGADPDATGPKLAEKVRIALQASADEAGADGVTVKVTVKAVSASRSVATEEPDRLESQAS